MTNYFTHELRNDQSIRRGIKHSTSFFYLVFFIGFMVPSILVAQESRAEEGSTETSNILLAQGLQLYEALQYEQAIIVLSGALLEPGNTLHEHTIILKTLGILYVYVNQQRAAALALVRLLCIEPDHNLSSYVSPRLHEVFNQVRQKWLEDGRPCEHGNLVHESMVGVRNPMTPVEESRKKSGVVRKWWFWTTIGATVAIALGLGFGLSGIGQDN